MQYDICGLGASVLDYITIVDEFPGHEGVYEVKNSVLQGGGPVATALVAASKLGVRTAAIAAVGDDWRSALILNELQQHGVETKFIKVNPGYEIGMATIHVRKRDGARAIVFSQPTATELIDPAQQRDLVKKSKILHINGRYLPECLDLSSFARKNDVKVSFDGGAGRYRAELDELLPLVDYLVVAHDFAEKWLGPGKDMCDYTHSMMAQGAELAIITQGAQGSYIQTKDRFFHQPAYAIEQIKDTTGCGDIYHGALLYALSQNWEVEKAVMLASICAALKARHLGGRGYLASLEEAIARFPQ